MAGEYVQVHTTLLSHRKAKRLARELNLSAVASRGHLITLWLNCLVQTPDGNLVDFSDDEIADLAEWEGDSKTFVGALVRIGWLDIVKTRDGEHLEIHDWEDYSGRLLLAINRKRERDKKRRQREDKRLLALGEDAPKALLSPGHPGTSQDVPPRTKQQNRQKKQTKETEQTEHVVVVVDRLRDEKGFGPERMESMCGSRLARSHMTPGQRMRAEAMAPFTHVEINRAFTIGHEQYPNREHLNYGLLLSVIAAQRRARPAAGAVRGAMDSYKALAKWNRVVNDPSWACGLTSDIAADLERLGATPDDVREAIAEAERNGVETWSEVLSSLRAADGPQRSSAGSY